jgi:cbb3-type cytochrome oxidase maturation protein
MLLIYIFTFASVLGLTGVGALFWALRSGQMDNFPAGARSIFDAEEPIGQITDRFPFETDTSKPKGAGQ